ncbi:MAG: two-component system OmpR family response regulator [Paracoccaceae bacterium]
MRALVVEDDQDLARQLTEALVETGYAVDTAHDGEEGHFLGDTEPYDVIVLDIGLPVMDGIEVLEQWRAAEKSTPVLILTARDRWREKIAGLDAGADDYVTKPFQMEEVLARIRALVRRSTGNTSPVLTAGPVALDPSASVVTVDDRQVKLTAHEYKLLAYMMHHKGKVLSRTELIEHIYAQDFDKDSNTIEVFVGRLRKKLGVDVIHTIRGLGYKLSDGDDAAV